MKEIYQKYLEYRCINNIIYQLRFALSTLANNTNNHNLALGALLHQRSTTNTDTIPHYTIKNCNKMIMSMHNINNSRKLID